MKGTKLQKLIKTYSKRAAELNKIAVRINREYYLEYSQMQLESNPIETYVAVSNINLHNETKD